MVTDDQVAAGLEARAVVGNTHYFLFATERCKCGADFSDAHVMRETLEYIERATEQEFEWGTRWEIPAYPPHPAQTREYLEPSRSHAEQFIKEDQEAANSSEPRGVLVRRRAAGPWEVVQ